MDVEAFNCIYFDSRKEATWAIRKGYYTVWKIFFNLAALVCSFNGVNQLVYNQVEKYGREELVLFHASSAVDGSVVAMTYYKSGLGRG